MPEAETLCFAVFFEGHLQNLGGEQSPPKFRGHGLTGLTVRAVLKKENNSLVGERQFGSRCERQFGGGVPNRVFVKGGNLNNWDRARTGCNDECFFARVLVIESHKLRDFTGT